MDARIILYELISAKTETPKVYKFEALSINFGIYCILDTECYICLVDFHIYDNTSVPHWHEPTNNFCRTAAAMRAF